MWSVRRIAACVLLIGIADATNVCGQETDFATVVAKVKTREISRGEVELLAVNRGIKIVTPKIEKQLTRLLIERYQVDRFLKEKRIRFDRKALKRQLEVTKQRITKSGMEVDPFLKRIGLDNRKLAASIEPSLRWTTYLKQAVSEDDIVAEFKRNKIQYDGTRVKVSQILIKADKNDSAARQKATGQLRQLEKEISSGKMTFAAAAKKHSQAPSGKSGGDVGWITWIGKLPASVSKAAFSLKKNEVSQPVESTFGVHLCTTTEIQPGELSPEDARPLILRKMAKAEWDRIVVEQSKPE